MHLLFFAKLLCIRTKKTHLDQAIYNNTKSHINLKLHEPSTHEGQGADVETNNHPLQGPVVETMEHDRQCSDLNTATDYHGTQSTLPAFLGPQVPNRLSLAIYNHSLWGPAVFLYKNTIKHSHDHQY